MSIETGDIRKCTAEQCHVDGIALPRSNSRRGAVPAHSASKTLVGSDEQSRVWTTSAIEIPNSSHGISCLCGRDILLRPPLVRDQLNDW